MQAQDLKQRVARITQGGRIRSRETQSQRQATVFASAFDALLDPGSFSEIGQFVLTKCMRKKYLAPGGCRYWFDPRALSKITANDATVKGGTHIHQRLKNTRAQEMSL